MHRAGLSLAVGLILAGCAHKAKKYAAPDAKPMQASHQRIAVAVFKAKLSAQKADASLAQVRKSVAQETAQLAVITPKLDELFRLAPLELRPLIESVQAEVEKLKDAHVLTAAQVEETKKHQTELAKDLEEANASKNQHAIDMAIVIAEGQKLAEAASKESEEGAKAKNRVRELESKNWIRRALEGLAALALIAFGFLWFTGKMALTGTKAAAAIAR